MHRERVLLVEDDGGVRSIVRRMLERRGFIVNEAENGDEALALLPGLDRIDVVVCDVVMPRRSGMDFVLELLRQRPGTPYIFVSGWPEHPAAAGARGRVLSKPFTVGELEREIRIAIDSALDDAAA